MKIIPSASWTVATELTTCCRKSRLKALTTICLLSAVTPATGNSSISYWEVLSVLHCIVVDTVAATLVEQANFKRIVIPPTCYGALSVTALIGVVTLTFWPLNRFAGYLCDVLPILGFLYVSVLKLCRGRHLTDGQTDRHHPSFYNAPSLRVMGGYRYIWYSKERTGGKGTDICIVPHSQKLTTVVLRYGSHSFYTANTPNLQLPRKLARWCTQEDPLLCQL